MNKITLTTTIEEYSSPQELGPEEQNLLKEAKEAAKDAYAPYSGFHVGAAVLLEDGRVVRGSNQENMASPSGLCAERIAIFAAGAQFPGIKIKAVAITAFSNSFAVNHPVAPCGGCRQAMAEYEERYGQDIQLVLSGEKGKAYKVKSVKSLLPLMFNEKPLKRT